MGCVREGGLKSFVMRQGGSWLRKWFGEVGGGRRNEGSEGRPRNSRLPFLQLMLGWCGGVCESPWDKD